MEREIAEVPENKGLEMYGEFVTVRELNGYDTMHNIPSKKDTEEITDLVEIMGD